MYVKIWTLITLLALSGCNNETNSTNTDQVSCAGYMSPSLSIYLIDSLSGQNVSSALVTLQTANSDGVHTSTIAWDDAKETYYVSPNELIDGSYSVTATESNYNTGVSMNNVFVVDASCLANNDWSISIYICPVGTTCM